MKFKLYEILTYLVLLLSAFAFLFYFFWRDRNYEKKQTRDVLSPRLKSEIDAERQESMRRKEKFDSEMRRHQI